MTPSRFIGCVWRPFIPNASVSKHKCKPLDPTGFIRSYVNLIEGCSQPSRLCRDSLMARLLPDGSLAHSPTGPTPPAPIGETKTLPEEGCGLCDKPAPVPSTSRGLRS